MASKTTAKGALTLFQWLEALEKQARENSMDALAVIKAAAADDLITVKAFIENHLDNVATSTVHYWMADGSIDYVRIGKQRYVWLTPKTLAKKPGSYGSKRK